MKYKRIPFIIVLIILVYLSGECIMAVYTLNEEGLKIDRNSIRPLAFRSPDIDLPEKSRVWAHAVYSVSEADEYINKYGGIETDVVYKWGRFVIAHGENLLVSQNANYTYLEDLLPPLSSYLAGLQNEDKSLPYIWLDCKNLTENIKEDFLKDMLALLNNAGISPHNVIIETPVAEVIDYFSQYGFKTSYFFEPDVNKGDKYENTESVNYAAERLLGGGKSVSYISCNVRFYSVVNKAFPDMIKNYWYYGSSIQMIIRSFFIRLAVMNRDDTGILLIDY